MIVPGVGKAWTSGTCPASPRTWTRLRASPWSSMARLPGRRRSLLYRTNGREMRLIGGMGPKGPPGRRRLCQGSRPEPAREWWAPDRAVRSQAHQTAQRAEPSTYGSGCMSRVPAKLPIAATQSRHAGPGNGGPERVRHLPTTRDAPATMACAPVASHQKSECRDGILQASTILFLQCHSGADSAEFGERISGHT